MSSKAFYENCTEQCQAEKLLTEIEQLRAENKFLYDQLAQQREAYLQLVAETSK